MSGVVGTSPDDVLKRIKTNQRRSKSRDRAIQHRLDILSTKVKGLYLHIAGLSALIVGDIVTRYVSSK